MPIVSMPGIDARVSEVAARQRGVVHLDQLRWCGLSSSTVAKRVRAGRLHRVHPAVYAVGHAALSFEARVLAATMSAAPAWACGSCAARLLGFYDRGRPAVEILVTRRHRPLAEVGTRFTRLLRPFERHEHGGLPMTTAARTMVELADDLSPHQLAHAIYQARRLHLVRRSELHGLLHRHRTRHCVPTLARAIELHDSGSGGTFSAAEDRALRSILEAGLPEPLVNVRMRLGRSQPRIDFRWPERRLCLEIDGGTHRLPPQVRRDRERDEAVREAGYVVLRVPVEFIDGLLEQLRPWFPDLLGPRCG